MWTRTRTLPAQNLVSYPLVSGFCNMVACADHLRKRRKKKNKFTKICQNCQDRYLSDAINKLQSKAEQSLAVAEEITKMKYDNFFEEVEKKRQKRKELAFRQMNITQKYDEKIKELTNAENKLMSLEHKVQSEELTVGQLQVHVKRLQASSVQNYEESFNILTNENSRLSKELAKVQKKCLDVRLGKEKREREIELAYQVWEKKQFNKKLLEESQNQKNQKKGCIIF